MAAVVTSHRGSGGRIDTGDRDHVYSIGPTARISQTVVFARPQKVYLPLAERNLAGAW
ncbi:MAG: hypothetical protein Q8O86_13385 [Dehalococcoidia bacterium]|nr:hypothetical protein [Dehalococcoidia bacterium]